MHTQGASKNIRLKRQDGRSLPDAPQSHQDWQKRGKSGEDDIKCGSSSLSLVGAFQGLSEVIRIQKRVVIGGGERRAKR